MSEPLSSGVEPSAEAPLQFGIRDMLIAQAVCAFCLGMLLMVGILVVVAIFVATLLLLVWHVRPENARRKRALEDLMCGVVLPILCIVYDPGILRENYSFVYVPVVFQMLALSVWLFAGPCFGRWGGVFAGVLFVGALISGCVGVALLPLSLIGLLAIIGMLGFTPLLTCFTFSRNTRDAIRRASASEGEWSVLALFLAGVLLAVVIPALIYLSAGPSIEHAIKVIPWPKGWPSTKFPRPPAPVPAARLTKGLALDEISLKSREGAWWDCAALVPPFHNGNYCLPVVLLGPSQHIMLQLVAAGGS